MKNFNFTLMLLSVIYCGLIKSTYSAIYTEDQKDKCIVDYSKLLHRIFDYYDPSKTTDEDTLAHSTKNFWLKKMTRQFTEDSLKESLSVSDYLDKIEKESYEELYTREDDSQNKIEKMSFYNLNEQLGVYLHRISKIKKEIKNKFGTLRPLTEPECQEYGFCVWTYNNYELKSTSLSDVSSQRDFVGVKDVAKIFHELVSALGRYSDLLTIRLLRKFNPKLY